MTLIPTWVTSGRAVCLFASSPLQVVWFAREQGLLDYWHIFPTWIPSDLKCSPSCEKKAINQR